MIICPKCKKTCSDDARFCNRCGFDLTPYRTPAMGNQDTGNIPIIQSPPRKAPAKSYSTSLVVLVSVLASVLLALIVFLVLYFSGILSFGNTTPSVPAETPAPVATVTPSPTATPAPSAFVPVSVEKNMYIGNCKQSVTMRSGPSTSAGSVCQIPLADTIYVYEYVSDNFARISYNGTNGYVDKAYIVATRPNVCTYNDSDVIAFTEYILRSFVNGINTGSTAYISGNFTPSEGEEELKTHNTIVKNVSGEEILSVNCHTVKRESATSVSVIRESTIRVFYKDGTQKDLPETYKTIIDLSSGSMRIAGYVKQ